MAKKKRRQPTTEDFGPAERLTHGDYRNEPSMVAGVKRQRNHNVDVLTTYRRRDQIDPVQLQAAEMFQAAYKRGMIGENYSSMDFDRIVGTGEVDDTASVNARQHVSKILIELGKPLDSLIIHVCGLGHPASTWPLIRKPASSMDILRIALDQMINYYKI
jgi:hypothetical protein|tara:strand:- start:1191 stop:1670 length:480 start_codon:yes stop_codon:yes gene_type:complete